MGNLIEVKVPDIGDFKNIPVIEVLAKPDACIPLCFFAVFVSSCLRGKKFCVFPGYLD